MMSKKDMVALKLEMEFMEAVIADRLKREYPGIDEDLLAYLVKDYMANPADITSIPEVRSKEFWQLVELEVADSEMDGYVEFSKNFIIDKKPQVKKAAKKATKKSGARKVICKTTGKVFDSMKQAAEFYGLKSASGISKCCKGNQKTSGTYNGKKLVWQFA